jgi:hypothetical protein
MSSALTEQTPVGISPPTRPSVWRVGWATFVGYFQAIVFGLPIAFGLLALGIDVFNGESRGVFLRYDVWSWLAEACVGLLATWFTAWLISDSLRHRTGWEVPFSFAFFTLLLTGYAPLLALTPLYGATAPVSLAAATLILRWRAAPAGAEPLKTLGAVPRRYRRTVAIGLAVAAPLMLGYVVAYGTTHPLRAETYGASPTKPWTFHPGQLKRHQLYIDKLGPFAVTDFSIVGVEGSPALQLERVVSPLGDYRPSGAGDTRPITLELRQGKLCPAGIGKLTALRVRYTVLDGRHEQRIPLENPPAVRCP